MPGPPDDGNWYDDWNPPEDQVATLSQYQTREAFVDAHFDLRRKLSQQVTPPSQDLEGDDYFKEIASYRIKGGGVEKPEDVQIDMPDDVLDFLGKHQPELVKEMKQTYADLHLTPREIAKQVAKVVERTQKDMANFSEQDEKAKNELLTHNADVEDHLKQLYGARYEKQMENVMAVPKHYDKILFGKENADLSEAERAEKGGVFEQEIREIEEAMGARPLLRRFLADIHRKTIAEGGGAPGGAAPGQSHSLYEQRIEVVKQMYPNSPELWESIAKGHVPLGVD